MDTSKCLCVFSGCPRAGKPRGNKTPPICDVHYKATMRKAIPSRPSEGELLDARVAATNAANKEAASVFGEPAVPGNIDRAVIDACIKYKGRLVHFGAMTGQVLGCRKFYRKPSVKVRLEDNSEPEMSVGEIQEGVLSYGRLLAKYKESTSFLDEAAVSAIAGKDEKVTSDDLSAHVARFGPLKAMSVPFRIGSTFNASAPTPTHTVFALGTNPGNIRLFLGLSHYMTVAKERAREAHGGGGPAGAAATNQGKVRGRGKAKPKPTPKGKGKGEPNPKVSPKPTPKGKGEPNPKVNPKATPKGKGKGEPNPKIKPNPKGKGEGKPTPKAQPNPKGKGKGKGPARLNGGAAGEGVDNAEVKAAGKGKGKKKARTEEEGAGAGEEDDFDENQTIGEYRKRARLEEQGAAGGKGAAVANK